MEHQEDLRPVVFNYLNYREFLKAFYEHKKRIKGSYSFRVFSVRAKIASPNYLKLVMDGKRNLTRENARAFANACDLKGKEAAYFIALVGWNQETMPEDREDYWRQMVRCLPTKGLYILHKDQVRILTHWHMLAIMEMLRLAHIPVNPEAIAKKFIAKVSPEEVKDALGVLSDSGLIVKNETGYALTNKNVFTGGGDLSPLIQTYHTNLIRIGLEALLKVSIHKRDFISSTFAIKKDRFSSIKDDIHQLIDKITLDSTQEENPETIYQLNIQFFPLIRD